MNYEEKKRLWTTLSILSITLILTFSHTVLLQTYVAGFSWKLLAPVALGLALATSAILHLLPQWYYYVPIALLDGFSISLKTYASGQVAAVYYGLFIAALIAAIGRMNELSEQVQTKESQLELKLKALQLKYQEVQNFLNQAIEAHAQELRKLNEEHPRVAELEASLLQLETELADSRQHTGELEQKQQLADALKQQIVHTGSLEIVLGKLMQGYRNTDNLQASKLLHDLFDLAYPESLQEKLAGDLTQLNGIVQKLELNSMQT